MEEEHKISDTKNAASKAEIMSSAKVIAGAAFGGGNEKCDKAEVAEAAADLLGAAIHYGKLEDSTCGNVLDKAENYLHNYGTSHSTTSAVHGGPEHVHSSDGGYGEYVKMAQGFMNKDDAHHHHVDHGHDGHGGGKKDHDHNHSKSNSGGYGDYIKMAQGILKK
ncbi:unnamed protein product [Amaranthus hypochondriacus]